MEQLHMWHDADAKEAFRAFARADLARAPAGDAALLAWWPGHKARVLSEGRRLVRALKQQQQQGIQERRAAAGEGLAAAYTAAAAQPTHSPQAAQQVMAAQQTVSAGVAADWKAAELRHRLGWLQGGERPSPAQSAAMRDGGRGKRAVPAMRNGATGALLPPGRPQADLVACHWARVSRARPVAAAAQQQVLQELAASTAPLSAAEATLLDALVSEQEVGRAIKRGNPGKAPVEDGLPVEVYQRLRACYVPVLTRVFAAAGRMGVLPRGFLNGVISTSYKAGERADPANYRPLTLLNTDYRVLANVLGA
jgi:hypothetical protein